MKQTLWITIWSFVLADVLIGVCEAASANIKSFSIDEDYEYDGEDDGKLSDLDPTQTSRRVSIEPPYFERSHIEVRAFEGERAVLDCNVHNFRNDSNTVMWYKGKTLISIGHDPVSNQYESLENNSIRIKNVELSDEGDYFCTVLPEKIQLHVTLQIIRVKTSNLPQNASKETPIDVTIEAGSSVVLDCQLQAFENDAITWYKGDVLIELGHDPANSPYERFSNNSIRIKHVSPADSGNYFCVNSNKAKFHIVLRVKGVQIYCNGLDFTNRSMTKKQGASLSCECKSTIPGSMEMKWSLNGQRAENFVTKIENGNIYIDNAGSEHEGIYQCLGDDNTKNPAIAAVAIYVNYEPKVSTHRHHVNAEIKDKAELYCDYKANPIGTVRWRKNKHEISYSDKFFIKTIPHHTRNRTILEIKDVNEEDFGEYECHVENTIGNNHVKIFLILEPETPQFEDMEIKGNTVKLHWLVRSRQPLSEAILDYKMSGTYTWSTVSMLSTKQHTHGESMWKITHEMELMPGKWHARVKTRNTVGWSKFSAQHDFIIDDVDDDKDASNDLNKEMPPQDMVMAAGVGLGRTNAANHQIELQTVRFTAILSVILINRNLLNNLL